MNSVNIPQQKYNLQAFSDIEKEKTIAKVKILKDFVANCKNLSLFPQLEINTLVKDWRCISLRTHYKEFLDNDNLLVRLDETIIKELEINEYQISFRAMINNQYTYISFPPRAISAIYGQNTEEETILAVMFTDYIDYLPKVKEETLIDTANFKTFNLIRYLGIIE